MVCNDCGTEVDNNCTFCPNCGAGITPVFQPENVNSQTQDNVAADYNAESEAQPETDFSVSETPVAVAQVTETGLTDDYTVNVPAVKKKKLFPLLLVSLILVLLIAVSAFAGITYGFSNLTHRFFDSPEKYLAYTVEKTSDKAFSQMDAVTAGISHDNFAFKGTYNIKAEDELKSILKSAGGANGIAGIIDSVNGVAVSFDVNGKEDVFGGKADIKLNDKDIIGAEFKADINNKKLYLSVPELSESCIEYDLTAALGDNGADNYKLFLDCIPETETLHELSDKYIKVITSNAGTVEKSSEKLEINGVSNKYIALKADLSSKDLSAVAKGVLEEAKGDEKIIEIVTSFAKAAGEDFDKEDYGNSIQSALDSIDSEAQDTETKAVLTVWIDSKGNIAGTEVSVPNSEYLIKMLTVRNGKSYAFESVTSMPGEKNEYSGKGTITAGKFNGECTTKYNDKEEYIISLKDVTVSGLSGKNISGQAELKFGNDIRAVAEERGIDPAIITMFKQFAVTVDIDSTAQSIKEAISFKNGEDKLLSMDVDLSIGKSEGVAEVTGEKSALTGDNAVLEWISGFKMDKVMDNMKQAGLSDEFLSGLQNAIITAMTGGQQSGIDANGYQSY